MEGALTELIGTRPADFVATRNRLVAELKVAGDAEAARELAKLRRPSLVDWALNVTVREQPELTAEWIAAAEAATDAQSSGGGELRATLTELRTVTNRFVKAVGSRAPAGDVAQALVRLAADPDLVGAFRRGTLGFDVDGEFATAAEVTTPAPKRTPRATPAPPDERAKAAVAAAQRELAQAESMRAEAEAELAQAADALDVARQAVHQAEREHLALQRRHAAAQRLAVEAADALRHAERALS